MAAVERPHQPVIASQKEADQLADAIIGVMERLDRVVSQESELLKTYRLREAAGLGDSKTEAARHYVQALDRLKANAIALARWAPAAVQNLKAAQSRLAATLEANMVVLATARSVSEGIIRNLAAEVAAPRTLTTYGAAGRAAAQTRPAATPLILSKRL